MTHGYNNDHMQMPPIGLMELSIHKAMATIHGQISLPGFQSDIERANQAIVQFDGPDIGADRWVNPLSVNMAGLGSQRQMSRMLGMLDQTNLTSSLDQVMAIHQRYAEGFALRTAFVRLFDERMRLTF